MRLLKVKQTNVVIIQEYANFQSYLVYFKLWENFPLREVCGMFNLVNIAAAILNAGLAWTADIYAECRTNIN